MKYLTSIKQTLINVKSALPNFLVRLYLDSSVHESFNIYDKDDIFEHQIEICRQYYQEIINADNCEVYTYFCEEPPLNPEFINHGKKRLMRFYPLIGNDTNTVVIREADGVVTFADCRAIDFFSKSKKIFYLLPYNKDSFHTKEFYPILLNAYTSWLRSYKIMEEKYFRVKNNLFDLLAGTFACNLKLQPQVFHRNISDLLEKLNNTKLSFDLIKDHLIKEDLKELEERILRLGLSKVNRELNEEKFWAIDEILLLDIFKDLISVNINSLEDDPETGRIYINYDETT